MPPRYRYIRKEGTKIYPLKQSTALTVLIFAHDANGDAVTGKVDGNWTKRISKNGGAFAAMTVTITELENGWYSVPLTAAHTDTLGILTMYFTCTGVKQVNLQFRVEGQLVEDISAAVFPAGAIEFTYTLTNSLDSLPIQGAQIWIATDVNFANIVWSGNSDSFGIARDVNNEKPFLDPGTYFIRSQKSGFSFPVDTEIVS